MLDDPTLSISRPDPAEAANARFVDRLVTIVNAAYAIGEQGMWTRGTVRVTADELRGLLRASELLVATVGERPVGCLHVHRLDDAVWGFGMLAAEPHAQGTGIGRGLVTAAERIAREAGATEMQLELLVPTGHRQESKVRLAEWYGRAGYRKVASRSFADDYPELAAPLAVPCDYQLWRKPLA
ncbi:GNAT family N-acetyltransferase [Herbiconiux sp. CPCC 205716]|uniref:GNAT family N-acetyltransferase n=1 Tax=Herbiconiux gentiana TaxID=2970912 RepID=A0ABT2GI92_9MICO|nr:GNAT family N-acetyltransferase [Herbiconiux gentiana]MCS5714619.1 GNAT family N-acetyltransferase [Herbiconiux gentiana]